MLDFRYSLAIFIQFFVKKWEKYLNSNKPRPFLDIKYLKMTHFYSHLDIFRFSECQVDHVLS